jgi:hypothetical protein
MQYPLEYTAYDGNGTLSVAAKVYNITDGTAAIDSTVAMTHVINGSYFGLFQATDTKDYLVNLQPYTDGTYASANTTYASNCILIKTRGTIFKKNTAYTAFTFPLYDTDGALVTGQTVTATRSLDGAAFAACANSVSEVASGLYKIDLAAADLNATGVTLKFTASGARAQIVSIFTEL